MRSAEQQWRMIDFMLKEEFKSCPWVVHISPTTCMHTTYMPAFGFVLVLLVTCARAWALPFWRWWGKNVFEKWCNGTTFFCCENFLVLKCPSGSCLRQLPHEHFKNKKFSLEVSQPEDGLFEKNMSGSQRNVRHIIVGSANSWTRALFTTPYWNHSWLRYFCKTYVNMDSINGVLHVI